MARGPFWWHLKLLDPDMTLIGIDFCGEMLAEAKRRSTGTGLRYSLSDLETVDFQAPCNANMVTSILAIDEMDQLEVVFRNIAKTLLPGGIAMLVVMDPSLELERNRTALEGAFVSKGQADEAILLVKTFPQSGPEQTAPYCRIVRPIRPDNASCCSTWSHGSDATSCRTPLALVFTQASLLFWCPRLSERVDPRT